MSFLSGLGKGLSRAFDGTNLAITQAILAGDYQGAAALRARQGELQRQLQQDQAQNDARDAQVIGAKNMGFSNDDWQVRAAPQPAAVSGGQGDLPIGAMSPQDLSAAVRQRAAFGSPQAPLADNGNGATPDWASAVQHAAVAVQRGADPDAVRARLSEMAQTDLDPPSPFSDLIPNAGQMNENLGGAATAQRMNIQSPRPNSGLTFEPQRDDGGASVGDGTVPMASMQAFRKFDQPREPSKVAATPRVTLMSAGGELKSDHPVSRPDVHIGFSSPRTGGPRLPTPSRSYSVQPYHPGGGINGNGYAPQGGDAQLLARAIYSEFRDTPQDMLAGGWSIVNRVGFRNNGRLAFGNTLTDVVTQPAGRGLHQYSFLDDGGSPAWRESSNPSSLTGPNQTAWSRAVSIANAILSSRTSDPSGGAHYFFASPTYTPGDPNSARPGFPDMLWEHHYEPTPYQSGSTLRDRQGRLVRNYFFRENPEKLMDPPRRGR